ncbi:hypothetical protein M3Y98_00884400 [Aphelenchoides besseyi]|nr:hypothetical protein M3Y98_00884400 [Aphelenchoides besseyi]
MAPQANGNEEPTDRHFVVPKYRFHQTRRPLESQNWIRELSKCRSGISPRAKREVFNYTLIKEHGPVYYYQTRETEVFSFSGRESPLSPVHTSPRFTIKGHSYESIQDFVRQKMFLELTGRSYIYETNSGWGFRAMLKHQGVTETQFDKWALERGLLYTQIAMVQKAIDSPTVLEELQRSSDKFIVYTFCEDRFYGTGEKMNYTLDKWFASRFQNTSVCVPASFPIKFTDLSCSPQLWSGHNVLGTLWMCLRQKHFVEKCPLSAMIPYIADINIPEPLPRPMPRQPLAGRFRSHYGSIDDDLDDEERTFSRTTTPRISSRIQRHSSYGQPLWEQGIFSDEDLRSNSTRNRISLPYARPSRQSRRKDCGSRLERATHPMVSRQRETGFQSHGDLRYRSPSPAHSSATTPPRPERNVTPTESEIDRQVSEAVNFVGIMDFARQQMQQKRENASRTGQITPSSQLARLQLRTPTEHVSKSSPPASIKSPVASSVRSTASRRPEDEQFLNSLISSDFLVNPLIL